MMNIKIIGSHYIGPGYYLQVGIHIDSENDAFIVLTEGKIGGSAPLADLADEIWAEHLQKCGCEFLATLAMEEPNASIERVLEVVAQHG